MKPTDFSMPKLQKEVLSKEDLTEPKKQWGKKGNKNLQFIPWVARTWVYYCTTLPLLWHRRWEWSSYWKQLTGCLKCTCSHQLGTKIYKKKGKAKQLTMERFLKKEASPQPSTSRQTNQSSACCHPQSHLTQMTPSHNNCSIHPTLNTQSIKFVWHSSKCSSLPNIYFT
jgi:hypothetical protein